MGRGVALAEKLDNAQTLTNLTLLDTPLWLAMVDAAGDGLELPAKTGGVG